MEKVSMHGGLVLSLGLVLMITAQPNGAAGAWLKAHATFCGGSDASGAMGGACGYGNLYTDGYEIKTEVLSTALFDDGKLCGGCYQIICDAIQVHQWCLKGTFITITATNFCPPNYALPSDNGGWCNPPRPHLDMSQPAFETIAEYRAGIVPILYRKWILFMCTRLDAGEMGGIRFTFNRRDYFELFLISNVGGAGEISNVSIKGSKMNERETISRNWEANWQSLSYLNGQSLSFRLKVSNGRTITALNVRLQIGSLASPPAAPSFKKKGANTTIDAASSINCIKVVLISLCRMYLNFILQLNLWGCAEYLQGPTHDAELFEAGAVS